MKLIVLCGKSGVGKTTLERKLVDAGIQPVTIYTTRTGRQDDPYYYIHVSKGMFNKFYMEGKFFHHMETGDGNHYGYHLRDTDKDSVVSFLSSKDIKAVKEIFDGTDVEVIAIELVAKYDPEKVYNERGMGEEDIADRESKSCGNLPKIHRDEAYEYLMTLMYVEKE